MATNEGCGGSGVDEVSPLVVGWGWEWERRNLVLNVLILESRQASTALASNPKTGINRGVPLLQNAATLAHLLASGEQDGHKSWEEYDDAEGGCGGSLRQHYWDLPPNYFRFLESFLLAEAQRHVYQAFAIMNKPSSLLAKMGAACVPLYTSAALHAASTSSGEEVTGAGPSTVSSKSWANRERCHDTARTWRMYFEAASEYHQAAAHAEKCEDEACQVRLTRAFERIAQCVDLCCSAGNSSTSGNGDDPAMSAAPIAECRSLAEELNGTILHRLASLPTLDICNSAVPTLELPVIQPTPPLKLTPACLSKLLPALPPLSDPPLFQTPPSSPGQQQQHKGPAAAASPSRGRPFDQSCYLREDADRDDSGGPCAADRDEPPEAISWAHHPRAGPRDSTTQPPSLPAVRSPSPQHVPSVAPSPPPPPKLQEIRDAVEDLAQQVALKADEARRALALGGLPYSVASYRRRHYEGGGIPGELWHRVHHVQQTQQDETLKSQLWQLRDDSERAQRIFQSIQSQLEEDLALDRMFREQHGDEFVGHKVHDVQLHFRRVLNDYSRLMASAQESDRILSDKLQILETDPKFRLLKFRKEQLDHLLPVGHGGAENESGDPEDSGLPSLPIDVSELSECLVELSEHIDHRDAKMCELQDLVDHVAHTLETAGDAGIDNDEEDENQSSGSGRRMTLEDASRHIRDQIAIIQRDLQEQKALVRRILVLNEAFLSARNATIITPAASAATESSSNILQKLGDALDELDQFASHLQEGTAFYKVIIPKLEKLQHNVGDVSARLAIERCEYDDRVRRNQQEEEDARVASEMSSSPHHPGSTSAAAPSSASSFASSAGGIERALTPGGAGDLSGLSAYATPVTVPPTIPSQHHPPPTSRVEQVSHSDGLAVRVDDAKVARLIELGFDPERAAVALRRYHNDMDQAINDLLS
jgi:hypothetical protein